MVVVVSSRRDVGSTAVSICEQMRVALAAQGIVATGDGASVERLKKLGGVDPKACDGARLCLQKLAQLLQGVVIGVDVSRAGKLSAGHFEAVSFDRVDSLAADDVTADAKSWPGKSSAAVTAFAAKLKAPMLALNETRRASSKPPEPELKAPPDAPREVRVLPEPPPLPPPAVTAEKSGTGPVPYVTGAAAVAALGMGIVFMVLGFIDRGTYHASFADPTGLMGHASSLSDDELTQLASSSNIRIGVGAGLIGLAVALGITSGVLLFKE